MVNDGLTEDEKKIIRNILQRYQGIDKALLFGSRVLNTFKASSDVDLAVKGENVSSVLGSLISDFEESNLIYEVDVIDYSTITSEELRKHIDEHGLVLYQRDSV